MLIVKNLHVSIGGKQILNGVSLIVKPGEVHAVMGPNGSGKSTLAYSLMGHPAYKIQNSKSKIQMELDGTSLLDMEPDARAKQGLFLAFQNPVAIPGVSVAKFLRHIGKERVIKGIKGESKGKRIDIAQAIAINKLLDTYAEELHIKKELMSRSLNDNFSGGEKKKIETLQMLFLKPTYAVIDEVDTGLDVDALKVVAGGVKKLTKQGSGMLIITHYNRILHYVKPDYVHVMVKGKIVKSGNWQLAKEIEKKGYTTM